MKIRIFMFTFIIAGCGKLTSQRNTTAVNNSKNDGSQNNAVAQSPVAPTAATLQLSNSQNISVYDSKGGKKQLGDLAKANKVLLIAFRSHDWLALLSQAPKNCTVIPLVPRESARLFSQDELTSNAIYKTNTVPHMVLKRFNFDGTEAGILLSSDGKILSSVTKSQDLVKLFDACTKS